MMAGGKEGSWRSHRTAVALVGVLTLLALAGPAGARPGTTLPQTIQDEDRDNRLDPAPGDEYELRQELGTAGPERNRTREELIFYGQLTDLHVVDEESPLRVEFLDRLGPPFTSAYRPQEGLSPQVLNEMVRQMRNANTPISREPKPELVMTTGDNSDNTQLNETRWFVDLLDGDKSVNPDSGVPTTPCEATPGTRYDGVRGDDEYYEPDESPGAEAQADNEDGPGYSPNQEENAREAPPEDQRTGAVRDFPKLFERMNEPFRATGLDLPWYGIFGNHDALVQGNQGRDPALERIATGCAKVQGLSKAGLARIREIASSDEEGSSRANTTEETLEAVRDALLNPESFGGSAEIVPPDPKRKPLRKPDFIAEHEDTTGEPPGHGFGMRTPPDQLALGQGYYSFAPKPGLRFVVLDSISENGGDGGNIDEEQYLWLEKELDSAQTAKELVMVFAHHTLDTMDQPPASTFPGGDQGGNPNPKVHFGTEGSPDRRPPCPSTVPSSGPTPQANESIRCQFLRHPGVIAFVAGHEHENKVLPFERPGTPGGPVAGGFWEIATAAHIDWPQQSRLIDLFDNRDGSLSIFGTILDHNGPPNPGGAPAPRSGQGEATDALSRLASISRELSFNDPDSRNGESPQGDARGGEGDRNVELIVRNPYGAEGSEEGEEGGLQLPDLPLPDLPDVDLPDVDAPDVDAPDPPDLEKPKVPDLP